MTFESQFYCCSMKNKTVRNRAKSRYSYTAGIIIGKNSSSSAA